MEVVGSRPNIKVAAGETTTGQNITVTMAAYTYFHRLGAFEVYLFSLDGHSRYFFERTDPTKQYYLTESDLDYLTERDYFGYIINQYSLYAPNATNSTQFVLDINLNTDIYPYGSDTTFQIIIRDSAHTVVQTERTVRDKMYGELLQGEVPLGYSTITLKIMNGDSLVWDLIRVPADTVEYKRLTVEVDQTWATAVFADVDLYLYNNQGDKCYYGNPYPDWGTADYYDDPLYNGIDHQNLKGSGSLSEKITIPYAVTGHDSIFSIAVEFFHGHFDTDNFLLGDELSVTIRYNIYNSLSYSLADDPAVDTLYPGETWVVGKINLRDAQPLVTK
jgi:hypothetical protein